MGSEASMLPGQRTSRQSLLLSQQYLSFDVLWHDILHPRDSYSISVLTFRATINVYDNSISLSVYGMDPHSYLGAQLVEIEGKVVK